MTREAVGGQGWCIISIPAGGHQVAVDAGLGTGSLAIATSEVEPGCIHRGIDPDRAAVAIVRREVERAGWGGHQSRTASADPAKCVSLPATPPHRKHVRPLHGLAPHQPATDRCAHTFFPGIAKAAAVIFRLGSQRFLSLTILFHAKISRPREIVPPHRSEKKPETRCCEPDHGGARCDDERMIEALPVGVVHMAEHPGEVPPAPAIVPALSIGTPSCKDR